MIRHKKHCVRKRNDLPVAVLCPCRLTSPPTSHGPQFMCREHDALCSCVADTPQNALLLCFVATVLKRMGADQMAGPRQLGHVSAGGHVTKARRFKKSAHTACEYLQTPSKNVRSTLNPFVCSSTRTLQRGRQTVDSAAAILPIALCPRISREKIPWSAWL